MNARDMMVTHPKAAGEPSGELLRCIEECYSCAQTCTSCADACLGEEMVKDLVECIRKNLDCADVCAATGAVASRQTGSGMDVLRALLASCAEACRICGEECGRHAEMHEHCKICADACRRCEEACRAAVNSLQ